MKHNFRNLEKYELFFVKLLFFVKPKPQYFKIDYSFQFLPCPHHKLYLHEKTQNNVLESSEFSAICSTANQECRGTSSIYKQNAYRTLLENSCLFCVSLY